MDFFAILKWVLILGAALLVLIVVTSLLWNRSSAGKDSEEWLMVEYPETYKSLIDWYKKRPIVFPAGTTLVCPRCQQRVGRLKYSLCDGDDIKPSSLYWNPHFLARETLVCVCGQSVAKNEGRLLLHTESGWVTHTSRLEGPANSEQ